MKNDNNNKLYLNMYNKCKNTFLSLKKEILTNENNQNTARVINNNYQKDEYLNNVSF